MRNHLINGILSFFTSALMILFSSYSHGEVTTFISTYKTFDGIYQQNKLRSHQSALDNLKIKSLLDIQKGVIDLQHGQAAILDQLAENMKQHDIQIKEAFLKDALDSLRADILTTYEIVGILDRMDQSNPDWKNQIAEAEHNLRVYRESRNKLFAKKEDITGVIEADLSSVWENEKLLMEITNSSTVRKVETAIAYINFIKDSKRHPDSRSSRFRAHPTQKKNLAKVRSEVKSDIDSLLRQINTYSSGFDLPIINYKFDSDLRKQHILVDSLIKPKEDIGKDFNTFVCGEQMALQTLRWLSNSDHRYMSDALKNHNRINHTHRIEGEITKNHRGNINVKGFSHSVSFPQFSIRQFYKRYPKIIFDWKTSSFPCSLSREVKQSSNRLCSTLEEREFKDIVNGTTDCKIPKNSKRLMHDGSGLLNEWVKKHQLSANIEKSLNTIDKLIDDYNHKVETYLVIDTVYENLDLLEERLIEYVIIHGGHSTDHYRAPENLSKAANYLNHVRNNRYKEYSDMTEQKISHIRKLMDERKSNSLELAKELQKVTLDLSNDHPLGFMRDLVNLVSMYYQIEATYDKYVADYLFSPNGEKPEFEQPSGDKYFKRVPANFNPNGEESELTLVEIGNDDSLGKQTNDINAIERNIKIIKSRLSSGRYTNNESLKNDLIYLQRSQERLFNLTNKLARNNDFLSDAVGKLADDGIEKALKDTFGKAKGTGALLLFQDGVIGDGMTKASLAYTERLNDSIYTLYSEIYKYKFGNQIPGYQNLLEQIKFREKEIYPQWLKEINQ